MRARQLNMLYLTYLITEQIIHSEWDARRRGLGVSAVTGLVMTARDLSHGEIGRLELELVIHWFRAKRMI